MIDWWFVVRQAIWVVGAAIVLTSWSYYRWFRLTVEERSQVSSQRYWLIASGAGSTLFCAGMALTGRWWETLAWAVLGLFATLRVWRAVANRSNAVISSRN